MADMCPHCAEIVTCGKDGLTPYHDYPKPLRVVCPGSKQHLRCAESDARPLWNGEANPHFGQEEAVTEQGIFQGTDSPEADEVRRLTKVWLDERAKCPTCEGTKRLYTSSQDDEGFPCPMCQRFDGPHCTCGLSDGHPEYAHTTSCPLSSGRDSDAR